MKIVLVGTAYPLRGGIAHYMALLAGHLRKRHDVKVVTFSRQYPAFLFPGKTQDEGDFPGHPEPAERLIDSINPVTWYTTARRIAAMKPDLLVFKYWLPFFGPCFGTIASLVRRWTGARVVFICDNVIPHERRPGDIVFTRFAFRFVDLFIVQSRAVERELLSFHPSIRPRFVPHPIYETFGKALPKQQARRSLQLSNKRVILFFGYVRRYKGLDTLLRAIAALKPSLDVHAMIVGEFYDDEQTYQDLIDRLGIRAKVTVVGDYVPHDRVGVYFSAADIVVLPYRSATQSGIVQIAYQFDKPVIATDVGGLAEVVLNGLTGMIVPPDDPPALTTAIETFYGRKLEAKFVRGVKQEKRKYSWDSLVTAIEEFAGHPPGVRRQKRG